LRMTVSKKLSEVAEYDKIPCSAEYFPLEFSPGGKGISLLFNTYHHVASVFDVHLFKIHFFKRDPLFKETLCHLR